MSELEVDLQTLSSLSAASVIHRLASELLWNVHFPPAILTHILMQRVSYLYLKLKSGTALVAHTTTQRSKAPGGQIADCC